MAMDTTRQRRTYPNLPETNWWTLRRRFQQTMPREVDASYLATVLHISEAAAGNLVPPLRTIGLIDDEGHPTDLALAWRDDEQYRHATTQMLESVYPQGLRDAAPPPHPDRGAVVGWFSRTTGAGQAATERMARLYLLLAAGDPLAGTQTPGERPTRPAQSAAQPRTRQRQASTPTPATTTVSTPPGQPSARAAAQPSVHIDIQVHIDPAATAEQIDQIFASMARHLYDRG